jgi:prepilin-type N-terminal cleavage/methylation domain-containing protein
MGIFVTILKPKQSAFTIVELLIVIVIIGILAAITIVAYNGIQGRARAVLVQSDLKNATDSLEIGYTTTGTYPANLTVANLPASNGTTYQYSVNNSATPPTYCLTATNGTTSYYMDNTTNTSPTQGGCPGDGQGGVAAITNLAMIPEGANAQQTAGQSGFGTGRWFGSGTSGTYSLITGAVDGPIGIKSYLRKTWTTAPAGNGDTGFNNSLANSSGTNSQGMPVIGGHTYTFSSYLRASSGGKIAYIQLYWHAADGTYISYSGSPSSALSAGVWTRLTFTTTAPANAATLGMVSDVDSGTLWTVGDTLDGTGLMITDGGMLYNYADGNSSNWRWNGTSNASTSTGPPL